MASVDAAWLGMEDPTNLMMVTGVLVLDGKVDLKRLKALRALVSELMSTPLDMTKPLWHVHLIDGHDHGSVVLARIHHSIADGIALVSVMLSLTDPSPQATPSRRRAEHNNHSGPLDWLPATISRGFAASQRLL